MNPYWIPTCYNLMFIINKLDHKLENMKLYASFFSNYLYMPYNSFHTIFSFEIYIIGMLFGIYDN